MEAANATSEISSYISSGVGAFFGVVAGALVQLFFSWLSIKWRYRQEVKNLIFEIEFNRHQIDKLLEQANSFRNAINAQSIDSFYDYLKYTSLLFITVNNLLQNGMLYKVFGLKEVAIILVLSQDFSPGAEKFVNEKIRELKTKQDYKEANNFLSLFIEKKLKESRTSFDSLLAKLKNKP